MKPSFAALLAALLCLRTVSSLTCFSCDKAERNLDCLKPQTCADTDNYCITKYFGGGVGDSHKQSISKGCSPTCPHGAIDLGVVAFSVDCCDTFLCNLSGAVSVKSSYLLLVLGTLASVFFIFGAKL